jgi:hypothetical protein
VRQTFRLDNVVWVSVYLYMKLMGSDSVAIIAGASEDVGSINFAERHPISSGRLDYTGG